MAFCCCSWRYCHDSGVALCILSLFLALVPAKGKNYEPWEGLSLNIVVGQVLLQYGGKFEVADEDGKTPLSIAAQRCEGDVVRYLLTIQRDAHQTKSRESDRESEKLE